MPKKIETTRIHSRVEITDPAIVKRFEAGRKKAGHKTKTHLEWIVAQYYAAQNSVKPQPEGER